MRPHTPAGGSSAVTLMKRPQIIGVSVSDTKALITMAMVNVMANS
jgi:hypothetical protein